MRTGRPRRECFAIIGFETDCGQEDLKGVECIVHYKNTHTNIHMKQTSNHPEGFADSARALCDEKHLAEELHNIENLWNKDQSKKAEDNRKNRKLVEL